MARGRLLREFLRERRTFGSHHSHRPPFARRNYQQERLVPVDERTLHVYSSTADQELGFSLLGAPRCSSESSEQSAPSTRSLGRESFGSLTTIHVGHPAYTYSSIHGGGIRKHFSHNSSSLGQFLRPCSTVSGAHLENELGGNVDGLNDASAGVVEKLASSNVQAINEVSAIIGDCSYPTAFVQILMDNMHTYFGLPWWGAIAATTIGIRLLCLPIVGYQLKTTAKLSLLRPEMEKINERIKASNYDPAVTSEGRAEILALFKQYKTHPFAPFVGALLQAPVFLSFFFSVQNMCQRLESFKDGGFLLFTDLTAKDPTFILPITLSAAMLLTVELNAADGMEGNPYGEKMKTFLRIFAVALCPISMNFEIALFFYWIPSNIFSMLQSFLFKQKAIKDYVGIPSTEHLSASSAPEIPVEAALSDESMKGSGKKRTASGRGKSRARHHR